MNTSCLTVCTYSAVANKALHLTAFPLRPIAQMSLVVRRPY